MSEFLPLDTRTGRVRGTSSLTGTEPKPIDFSEVFVVGLGVNASQSSVTQLVTGQSYIDVAFEIEQVDDQWVFVQCAIVNTVDANPLNIWPGIVTSKTVSGFRLQLNGMPDSNNYFLHWSVNGVNITPVPATSYILSGPASGPFGASATFTVHLPASTTVPAPVTVTPSDGGAGGTFTPTTVNLTTAVPSRTFTYTPTSYGARTISTTNNRGLTNPAPHTFTCLVPTYTLTGPSGGVSGVASTPFTVALSGAAAGTVTVTPSSGGGGGTFTPATVALTTGTPSATFTYTPATAGTKTISVTNDGGLANPANLTYTATTPPFDPTTIAGLKLWLKADSLALSDGAAVSTWNDSSGLGNNATQSGAARPIYKTSIVNGKPVVRFDGVDDYMPLTTEITTPTNEYTAFAVYKTTGDNCFLGSASVVDQQIRVGQGGGNILSNNVSGGVGSGSATSATLSVARSAWNVGCVRLHTVGAGTVDFFDASGYLSSGAGGITLTSKVGVVGVVGVPPVALYVSGDVAEILFYDRAVAVSPDTADLLNYLKTKYAIP